MRPHARATLCRYCSGARRRPLRGSRAQLSVTPTGDSVSVRSGVLCEIDAGALGSRVVAATARTSVINDFWFAGCTAVIRSPTNATEVFVAVASSRTMARDATAQCNAGDACLYFCRAEYRFVFLLAQTGHHRARDCRERGRERHFQQGESATAGGGNQVCGHTLVGKAGPETQSRYFCGGQTVDVLAVVGGVRAHQCQPGGEHQLAPGKPRCGVRQLCGLRERDGVGGSCSVGEQSQREVFLAQEPRDRNRHLIKASCRCRYGVALELRVSISAVLAMLRASHTRMQYTTERVVT